MHWCKTGSPCIQSFLSNHRKAAPASGPLPIVRDSMSDWRIKYRGSWILCFVSLPPDYWKRSTAQGANPAHGMVKMFVLSWDDSAVFASILSHDGLHSNLITRVQRYYLSYSASLLFMGSRIDLYVFAKSISPRGLGNQCFLSHITNHAYGQMHT